jgi:hypothetical protein
MAEAMTRKAPKIKHPGSKAVTRKAKTLVQRSALGYCPVRTADAARTGD